MRNYNEEIKNRIEFIRNVVEEAGADGIVFANSGGKDCALVGILCKKACDNTISLILPCSSRRNYNEDKNDAEALSSQFGIENMIFDLTNVKNELVKQLNESVLMNQTASVNIAPKLRMTTLYAVANSQNRLVAGTGNRSERHMGYFTKWGDGACDFNPIADLTVTEVYEFLEFLGAPKQIIKKAPSAGLYDGQTDELEMGITYKSIDAFLLHGEATDEDMEIINKYHSRSNHKRQMPIVYEG